MALYDCHPKVTHCRLCSFKLPEDDFPESDATNHLRDSHPDVLEAAGDLKDGETLDDYFKFYEAIHIRNVKS